MKNVNRLQSPLITSQFELQYELNEFMMFI